MDVIRNYKDERVIESYTITGITRADMFFMTRLHDRIMDVIGNHLNKKAEKRVYLNDDDLYEVVSVLDILTMGNRTKLLESEFSLRKEELIQMHKELCESCEKAQEVEEWDDEAIAEQTSPSL